MTDCQLIMYCYLRGKQESALVSQYQTQLVIGRLTTILT